MANAATAVKVNKGNVLLGRKPLAAYFLFEVVPNSAEVKRNVLFLRGNGFAGTEQGVFVVTGSCAAEVRDNVIFVN